MKQQDLRIRIKESYPRFTKSEKKVADYVLAQPEEVLQATISDLAESCGVGDTTVFRFCRTLKLKGYQDFRMALALSTSQNLLRPSPNQECTTLEDLCQEILHTCVDALDETFHMLDYGRIEKAVDLLLNANFIYFFGMGGSGITAMEAKNKFRKLTPAVVSDADTHIQLTTAALLKEGDLAVVFSNSGTTRDAIEITRLAKEQGAGTVFITRFAKTPGAQYTDILLLSGAYEGPMQGGSIAAKVSQHYMVDVLYEEYFRRMGSQAIENKRRTSMVVSGKML